MTSIPQSAFNVDALEGAVMHVLTICGNLSDVALDSFSQRYAASKGKRLKFNYATKKLLPRLVKEHKVFRIGTHMFSTNPLVRGSTTRAAQDAFWVYLEYLNSEAAADIVINTLQGPHPSQLTFINDGKIYHICRVEGSGDKELAFLSALEVEQQRRLKRTKDKYPPNERFILMFSSEADAARCRYQLLNSPVLYCIISYDEGAYVPRLRFANPSKE